MLKIISSVCAAAMALSLPFSAPALSMPLGNVSGPQSGLVTNVQWGTMGAADQYERSERIERRDDRWDRRPERREDRRLERRDDRRYDRREDRRSERRDDRRDDRWDRRSERHDRDYRHGRVERRGDRYYYRGHRGYRDPRPGYRQYDGWWFPPAAFIAGAIVGGALNQPPAIRAVPVNAHVDWCYSRYRSYRERDNTFQPNNGPRRQCISPYS